MKIRQWLGGALFVVWLWVIVSATLTPGGWSRTPGPCILLCGERGFADFLANVLLFVPFGAGLGLLGLRPRYVLVVGMLASIGIELAQLSAVAGRDASVSDVFSNSTGSVIGGAVGWTWRSWLNPPASLARRYLLAAVVMVLMIVGATGYLVSPAFSGPPYLVRWTTGGPVTAAYSGSVEAVVFGDAPVTPAAFEFDASVRDSLLRGMPLRLVVEAGPPADRVADIMSIESGGSDVLLVSADGEDLVLRYRSRAVALRLDRPVVRLSGVLAGYRPGETFVVDVWRGSAGFCLGMAKRFVCREFTPSAGWSLIQNADSYSLWMQSRLRFVWLAFLTFPLGLWLRPERWSAILLLLVAAGLAVVPPLVGLAALSSGDVVAVVCGVAAGLCVRLLAAARSGSKERDASPIPDG